MNLTNGQALADLQGRLTAWRRNRPHRSSRIPEPLWRAAVQAAREVGVSQTSQRLGLDQGSSRDTEGWADPP